MSHNGCYDNSFFCPKGFELPILTQTKIGFYKMPAQILLIFTITLVACTTIPSKKESMVKVMSTSTVDGINNQELRFTGTIRNIYRVISRKIRDFSEEQLQNLTAITWLYRGETHRAYQALDDARPCRMFRRKVCPV